MPNIPKPTDVNTIWATTGSVVAPDATKVRTGWIVEIPPHEQANWVENRQDRFNAHVNQHGIPLWDSATEYQANLSYSKGSNGTVYRAVTTNSNVNPVTDTTGAWTLAFSSAGLQRFTANGSFTVPAGKTVVYVTAVAGGGGGGGGAGRNNANGSGGGGGGGAGASAIKVPISVTPGQVIPITIGAGGAGGANTTALNDGGSGVTGGNTTFGTLLTLAGGQGGGGGITTPAAGGVGGTPGGQWGTDGALNGGVAGSGGSGGSGPFGTAGGGGRSRGSAGEAGPSPSAGYGTGGGGGGAAYSGTPISSAGGAGRPGLLIVEWF